MDTNQPSGSRSLKRQAPEEFDEPKPATLPAEREKLNGFATDSENSEESMVSKVKKFKLDEDDGVYHEDQIALQELQKKRDLLLIRAEEQRIRAEEQRIRAEEQRIRAEEQKTQLENDIAAVEKEIADQQRKIDNANKKIPDFSDTTSSGEVSPIADEDMAGVANVAAEDTTDENF